MAENQIDKARLNAALAEHLFGLKMLSWKPGYRLQYDTGFHALTSPFGGLSEPVIGDVPDYADTWLGMGLVIGAMMARGYRAVLRSWTTRHPPRNTAVFYQMTDVASDHVYADGATLPEAVALAALKAVGPGGAEDLYRESVQLEKGESA